MSLVKTTPQEIYQVLEQQKKLTEMREKLVGVLNKVNQTINSIAVIFCSLTRHESTLIDEFSF